MGIEVIVNILQPASHNAVYRRQVPQASLDDCDAPKKHMGGKEMTY
jgi:hypothetical protein